MKRKKGFMFQVDFSDLSESTRCLLSVINNCTSTWSKKERIDFENENCEKLGKKVLTTCENYIEELAEKMNEQGHFDNKEKDDART